MVRGGKGRSLSFCCDQCIWTIESCWVGKNWPVQHETRPFPAVFLLWGGVYYTASPVVNTSGGQCKSLSMRHRAMWKDPYSLYCMQAITLNHCDHNCWSSEAVILFNLSQEVLLICVTGDLGSNKCADTLIAGRNTQCQNV